MTDAAPPNRRVDALDGLRGLAVAAVLAFHAGHLRGGFLGVSTFFTLSGFLITRLLLAEVEATDFCDLRRFWGRRARRLLPGALACAFGALAFAATIGTSTQVSHLRGDMAAALAQVANWRFLLSGQDYADRFADPSPLQHFWSLAIEEQFYVALPLAIWFVARRNRRAQRYLPDDRRRPVLAGAIALGVVGVAVGMLVSPQHAYYSTLTRLPELLVGVALAAWLGRGLGLRRRPATRRVAALAPLAVAVLALLWWRTGPTSSWLPRGGFLLNAAATASLVVACHGRGVVARALALRPLAWLGRVSYGVYLYHWPVFLWLSPARTGLDTWPLVALRAAVTLALAQLSWTLLEHPVRHRRVLRGPSARYALAGAGALVVANLVLVTARPPEAAVAFTPVRGEAPAPATTTPTTAAPAPPTDASTTSTTAAPPPPRRIMIVGDSIGLTLAGGMIEYNAQHPDWRIYVDAESGCSLATGGRLRALGYDADDAPKCAVRNSSLSAHVAEFRPDVVIVLSCLWEVADRQLPGETRWRAPGDPEYDGFTARTIDETATAVTTTGARVAWLNCPHLDPDYHPEHYMGPPPYPVAEPARIARYNELLTQVLADHPVDLLDLAGFLQAMPGGDLDRSRRPDGVHLSRPVAHDIGVWALAQLDARPDARLDTGR